MNFGVKYSVYFFAFFLVISCEFSKNEDKEMQYQNFDQQEITNIDAIKFRGRLDKVATESFDFLVNKSGEFMFDIKKPTSGVKLLVVDKSSKYIINEINNNQIIDLDEGNYNLVVINQSNTTKPTEVVFEIVKY